MSKPNLLIDLDGTIASQEGGGACFIGPILPNARHAILLLSREFNILIFTTRGDTHHVREYLVQNGLGDIPVTDIKENGLIVDDKAITFTGEWTEELLSHIRAFKPHWKST